MFSFRSGNRDKILNDDLVQNKLVGVSSLLYGLVYVLNEPSSATTWVLGLNSTVNGCMVLEAELFPHLWRRPSRTGTYYRKIPLNKADSTIKACVREQNILYCWVPAKPSGHK